jgi:putative toxin-antitoxin system antitoxin component (TIGR02293 family)
MAQATAEVIAEKPGVPKDVERLGKRLRAGESAQHIYPSLLGLRVRDTVALLRQIERGLSYAALERLQRNIDLSLRDLAELVRISPRTLARRKEKGRLEPDESDRLLRVARIFAKALGLFEGEFQAARGWLFAPQPALNGATPIAFARTEVGAREVEQLIGRLEHGIPS